MKQVLTSKPDLIEQNFRIVRCEKRIEPGFIDIYGIDKYGTPVIVEIKRNAAGKDSILQLWNYIKAMKGAKPFRGIIAAPSLKKDCFKLLKTLNLEFKQIDPRFCSEIISKQRPNEDYHSMAEYL